MRPVLAGPSGSSKPQVCRVDFTPFKALPGETLAPVQNLVPPPSSEPLSQEQALSIWREIIEERTINTPAPFSRDIWLYIACRFLPLQSVAALAQSCRALRDLLSTDALWRDLFISRYGPLSFEQKARESFASWKGLLKHRIVTGRDCFWTSEDRKRIDFNPFGSNSSSSENQCIIRCKCCPGNRRFGHIHGRKTF